MFRWLDQVFRNSAELPIVLVFVLAWLGCTFAFNCRSKKLGHKSLDSAYLWYSQTDAKTFLHAIGPDGRNLYAATQLTLDLVYPIVYGVLLGWLLVCVYPPEWSEWIVWLPLLAVMFDLGENFTTAYLALTFAETESTIATMAAICTLMKWSMLSLGALAFVGGGIVALVARYFGGDTWHGAS